MDNNTTAAKTGQKTKFMAMTGLMTAAICIIAPFSIPLPFSPVPISFTNFVIFIAIYILGMKAGVLSLLIYLALGTVGLPVFSGFSGGLAKLAGPTGGYLIGFIFLALIQGFIMERFDYKTSAAIAGMVAGMAVCYIFGTVWLAFQVEQSFVASLSIGVIPYLPGDVIKIIAAVIIGPKLRAAIQRI